MANEQDYMTEWAERETKEVAPKRPAPEAPTSKAAKERAEREKAISRGVSAPWRLHPDIAPAIKKAAEKENVTQRELVEYVLTAALQGLANGKLKLPKRKTGSIFSIDFQGIPDEFKE
jgi:hypothetical protein